MAARIVIRFLDGAQARRTLHFPLDRIEELAIGRDANAAIAFSSTDDVVSRQHALIRVRKGDPPGFSIVDLKSRNGTYLNDRELKAETPLAPGDKVQLAKGGPRFVFEVELASAREAVPAEVRPPAQEAEPEPTLPPSAAVVTRQLARGAGGEAKPVGGDAAEDAEGRVERRLAAILAADVTGYSRLMGADEEGTLQRLKAYRRQLIDPKFAQHHGRLVKTTGDGLLVEFASVVDAVRCAGEMQRAVAERNAGEPEELRIVFRIGINIGDIIIDGDDVYGDGVNVAARLEAIAKPGGICISASAYEQVRGKVAAEFIDMGEQSLKNIARPVRAYQVAAAGSQAAAP